MKRRPELSIAYRLTGWVLAIAAVVIAILLVGILFFSYRLQVQSIEEAAQEIESLHLPRLTAAVWDFAEQSVRVQIDSLHSLRHVGFVALSTSEGVIQSGTRLDDDAIEHAYVLRHPLGGVIGRLQVQFSLASVRSEVFDQVLAISGYILLPFVILALAILLVFRSLVTRHLNALAAYARGLSMETLDRRFRFQRKARPFPDELDGLLDAFDSMRGNLLTEIEGRQCAEQRLCESEQLRQEVFNATSDAIFIHDSTDGRILDVNQAMLDMYGRKREELPHLQVCDLASGVSPHDEAQVAERMALAAQGQAQMFEWLAKRSDGQTFWVEVSLRRMEPASRQRILAVVRDISDRKAAEEQLRQFQKMDSIGRLAGGVAHDFNNLLGGILGAADMINLHTTDSQVRKYTEMISTTTKRAAELTSKLLAFSRKGKLVSSSVDMHQVVGDALAILERSIDKRIVLQLDWQAEQVRVDGDASQLQNAILNLGLNARDAMPEGGPLRISARNLTLGEQTCDRSPFGLQPGEHLEISVQDSGSGVDPAVADRIFEPFFTTKEVGKGTGLGLAAAYGTIKEHGGAISVESEPGRGSTFRLLLPVGGQPKRTAPDSRRIVTGAGRVLVVDDEEVVRQTIIDRLEKLGYEVLAAGDGQQAVEVFREQRGRIDLLILDMVMPRMNGRDAFAAIRAIDPQARILISTGFIAGESIDSLLRLGACGVLHKPFEQDELSQVVAEALSRETVQVVPD